MKVSIEKIKPNPKNPRVIKDEKFKQLVKSIAEFPQMLEKRPLVCFTDTDGNYIVLGGNMRLKAAMENGMKELPILLADDWTEEQKNEFLIKDNVGFGEWEWSALQSDWDIEKLSEWGLDIPFFDTEENKDDLTDLSDKIKTEFKIEVIAKNEQEQESIYNKLIELNYQCRILTL
jgi:hypothetical protein